MESATCRAALNNKRKSSGNRHQKLLAYDILFINVREAAIISDELASLA